MTICFLRDALEPALAPLGFRTAASPEGVAAAWVRKTWNTNRAVVLVERDADDLGPWAQANKLRIGTALGYFPFFYGMGLQVVGIVPSAAGADGFTKNGAPLVLSLDDDALGAYVDRIDNQRCIIQSLFAVDRAGHVAQARTWGQLVTGRFQDAIARTLDDAARTFRRPPHA